MSDDLPLDPRLDRYRPLSRALTAALVATVALAAITLLLPERAAGWTGAAVVSVLVAAPLARVVWLVRRWLGRGDRRYAAVGVAVLAVIAGGVLIAALRT
jgi:hypothetical protein